MVGGAGQVLLGLCGGGRGAVVTVAESCVERGKNIFIFSETMVTIDIFFYIKPW